MKTALAAAGLLLLLCAAADASPRRAARVNLAPVPVSGAMVDDRYPHLRLPEAYGTARGTAAQVKRQKHSRRQPGKPPPVVVRKSLPQGFVAEVRKALPQPKLAGVVPVLAEKVAEICRDCGSKVISGVRHTYVAGTHKISLHASGKAVDIAGNPKCIYAHLKGWSGGYSTDYAAVGHAHISYDLQGGREMGARFAHHRGHGRTLSARRHHHHHRHRWRA